MKKNSYIIAISGGSGSGKTTFCHELAHEFSSAVIHLDNYYKENWWGENENIINCNFDTPDSIDFEFFIEQINLLSSGISVDLPQWSMKDHKRLKKTINQQPMPFLFIEGLFVLSDWRIRELSDLKIFIDISIDEMLARRIKRDETNRGINIQTTEKYFGKYVKPNYLTHVLPSKKYADFIISESNREKEILTIKDLINQAE